MAMSENMFFTFAPSASFTSTSPFLCLFGFLLALPSVCQSDININQFFQYSCGDDYLCLNQIHQHDIVSNLVMPANLQKPSPEAFYFEKEEGNEPLPVMTDDLKSHRITRTPFLMQHVCPFLLGRKESHILMLRRRASRSDGWTPLRLQAARLGTARHSTPSLHHYITATNGHIARPATC